MTRFRVGVDIGGTFTDIVLLDADGRLHTKKVSSSVDDYARAIVEGVGEVFRETGLVGADVAELLHGTTVASNAIIELRGAKTGLITTKGFRDILEIRRLRMPRLYDLTWEKPAPLVERYLRVEVQERINARGEVQAPLDPVDVERVLDRLLGEGIEALAVCLLNSYANPVHEERIKEIVARRAPGLVTCISAEVLPEIREYERTSTTVINAYVMPIVRSYLATLRSGLDDIGVKAPLLIMQSNGGLMTDAAAAQKPIHVIESGPAAGVVGAQVLAQRLDLGKLITFDMGGTTAKAALVEDGDVSRAAEYQVGGGIVHGSRLLTGAGYLLRVPAIDLAEVGAGGGSLVWIDAGGALQVGPRSAGASPGPLCYDLGGTEPTITDANVILGYLNPTRLAGGAVKLNAARAHQVFEEKVVRPLGLPPAPGLFSSFGLLYADVEHHYVRTWRRLAAEAEPAALGQVFHRMETEATEQLAAEGFTGRAVRIRRAADCRYQGQSFELTVPVTGGSVDRSTVAALAEAFGQEHERTYGHRAGPDEPVEIVSLRVVAQGLPDRPRVPERLRIDRRGGGDPPTRRVYFGPDRGWQETPILDRPDLATPRVGPCIIEEYDATCVVPPGARAALDAYGNIMIELGQEI